MKNRVGDYLRSKREELGLTARGVGADTSYSKEYYSRFENGTRPITDDILNEVIHILGLTDNDIAIIEELRAFDKGRLPKDMASYLIERNASIEFIKLAMQMQCTNADWERFKRVIKLNHFGHIYEHSPGEGVYFGESIVSIEERSMGLLPLRNAWKFFLFDSIDSLEDLGNRNGHRENVGNTYYIGIKHDINNYKGTAYIPDGTLKKWRESGLDIIITSDIGAPCEAVSLKDEEMVLSPDIRKTNNPNIKGRVYFKKF